MERIKIGLIGFGRMGEKYLSQLRASGKWEVAYICDVSPGAQAYAREICPGTCITGDEDVVFNDPEVRVVGLFTLADSRYRQIRKAVEKGKHILAEKPIADTLEHEKELVDLVESSSLLSAVNLYLRNSWYHNCIKDFISSGEIGDLAIIRICHLTPGLALCRYREMVCRMRIQDMACPGYENVVVQGPLVAPVPRDFRERSGVRYYPGICVRSAGKGSDT